MESEHLKLESIEVSGEAAMALLHGFPDYLSEIAKNFLLMNEMQEPEPGCWVSLSKVIQILDSISKKFGEATLYEIGKAIPTNALLPSNVKSFKDALIQFSTGFSINHRNCDVCKVELLEFNNTSRKAIVQITNPYPFEMNRGIVTCLARKYEPQNATKLPEVFFEENSCVTLSAWEKRCKIRITW